MTQLSHTEYEMLERAVVTGQRLAIFRRGTEYVVIPVRLAMLEGKEAIEARHPATGAHLVLRLDDIESIEVVR